MALTPFLSSYELLLHIPIYYNKKSSNLRFTEVLLLNFHEFDEGANKCRSRAVVQKNKLSQSKGRRLWDDSHRGTSLGHGGGGLGIELPQEVWGQGPSLEHEEGKRRESDRF